MEKKIRFRCQIAVEKYGTIMYEIFYIYISIYFNLQNIKERTETDT